MESRTVRASCSAGVFIDSSWATFTETWKDRCNCGQLRVRLTLVRDISGVLCQPESFDSPCIFRLNTANWSITKQNLFSHTRREFASASPKQTKARLGKASCRRECLGAIDHFITSFVIPLSVMADYRGVSFCTNSLSHMLKIGTLFQLVQKIALAIADSW